MTKIYKYTVLPIMIFTFVWVIFGDLVNLHMKLIYKLNTNTNEILYVKSFHKQKNDNNYSLYKIVDNHHNNGFFCDFTDLSFSIHEIDLANSQFCSITKPYIFLGCIGLRAPPSFL